MQDEGENVEKLPSDRFGSRFLLLGYEPDGETARERKRESIVEETLVPRSLIVIAS